MAESKESLRSVRHVKEASSKEEILMAEAEPEWLRLSPRRDHRIIVPETVELVLRAHIVVKFVTVTYVDGKRQKSKPAGESTSPTNRRMTVRIDEGMKVEYFGAVKDTKTRCFIADVVVDGQLKQLTRMRDGRISMRAYNRLT